MKTKCKNCDKDFDALQKELDRGNAKFCSRSCSALYNGKHREKLKHTCKACNNPFTSKAKHAIYCSTTCKNISIKPSNNKYRYHLSHKINKLLKDKSCANCKWDSDVCDIHHIIPRAKGGTDNFDNLILLCPNCHRLVHKNKLDVTKISTISDRIGLYLHQNMVLDAVGSP